MNLILYFILMYIVKCTCVTELQNFGIAFWASILDNLMIQNIEEAHSGFD